MNKIILLGLLSLFILGCGDKPFNETESISRGITLEMVKLALNDRSHRYSKKVTESDDGLVLSVEFHIPAKKPYSSKKNTEKILGISFNKKSDAIDLLVDGYATQKLRYMKHVKFTDMISVPELGDNAYASIVFFRPNKPLASVIFTQGDMLVIIDLSSFKDHTRTIKDRDRVIELAKQINNTFNLESY
ncbi:MAG: hypothetical protein HOM11_14675 [Methylococcales bacterium]|nr:hypothetical protein [Methylococcales bacterium]